MGQLMSALTGTQVKPLAKKKEQFLPRVVLAQKKETKDCAKTGAGQLGCRFFIVISGFSISLLIGIV